MQYFSPSRPVHVVLVPNETIIRTSSQTGWNVAYLLAEMPNKLHIQDLQHTWFEELPIQVGERRAEEKLNEFAVLSFDNHDKVPRYKAIKLQQNDAWRVSTVDVILFSPKNTTVPIISLWFVFIDLSRE